MTPKKQDTDEYQHMDDSQPGEVETVDPDFDEVNLDDLLYGTELADEESYPGFNLPPENYDE